MDNQPAKKKAELKLLRQFKEAFSDFPKGKIIARESPDFIIKTGRKRTVGIELIQLFSAKVGNKKKHENLIESIEKALLKKEEKLRLYRKNILENYWLLITTDTLQEANFNVHNLLEKFNFESSFDSVFLFEASNEKIYFLK